MEYLLYKTTAFLLFGLCSSQSNNALEGPLNKAVGQNATFKLTTPPSTPPEHINWDFKGVGGQIPIISGTQINLAYKDRVSVDKNTASLELRNLTINDTGEYILSFSLGTEEGRTSLTVSEEIYDAAITIPSNTVLVGETFVNLTCDAKGTIITREWTINDKPLPLTERITLHEENRTLSISTVEKEDSGLYTCTVSNPVSSDTANSTLLAIYGPLDVKVSPLPRMKTGSNVALFCQTDSVPAAHITWMFKGSDIGDKPVHIIQKFDSSHAGDYTCTAWNSITDLKASASHSLEVDPSSSLTNAEIAGIGVGLFFVGCLVTGLIGFGLKKAGIW